MQYENIEPYIDIYRDSVRSTLEQARFLLQNFSLHPTHLANYARDHQDPAVAESLMRNLQETVLDGILGCEAMRDELIAPLFDQIRAESESDTKPLRTRDPVAMRRFERKWASDLVTAENPTQRAIAIGREVTIERIVRRIEQLADGFKAEASPLAVSTDLPPAVQRIRKNIAALGTDGVSEITHTLTEMLTLFVETGSASLACIKYDQWGQKLGDRSKTFHAKDVLLATATL